MTAIRAPSLTQPSASLARRSPRSFRPTCEHDLLVSPSGCESRLCADLPGRPSGGRSKARSGSVARATLPRGFTASIPPAAYPGHERLISSTAGVVTEFRAWRMIPDGRGRGLPRPPGTGIFPTSPSGLAAVDTESEAPRRVAVRPLIHGGPTVAHRVSIGSPN